MRERAGRYGSRYVSKLMVVAKGDSGSRSKRRIRGPASQMVREVREVGRKKISFRDLPHAEGTTD